MRASVKLLIVVLVLTVAPLSARMAPIVWTLSGVTFSDGGTASGSFTFDANTNTYSAPAITTTAGSVRGAASYSFAEGSSGLLGAFFTTNPASDQTGLPALLLQFSAALTGSGGTVPLTGISEEATCASSDCSAVPSPATVRTVTAGFVTTNSVPTMPAWVTVGAALATFLAAAWILRGKRLATDVQRRG